MVYFISDTHFFHENIIKLANRPFSSIEKMNQKLIENWNRKIKGNDTVYILGDMFFRCKESENIENILSQLNGKKHLIIGNHDSSWMDKVNLNKYFVEVTDFKVTTNGEYAVTLCHYPLLTWKHESKSYMIHGHIHANTTDDFFPLICKRERVLNAGIDINNFEPCTLEELIRNNNIFKEQHKND